MVMTILEAQVMEDHWAALGQAFQQGSQQIDAGLVQSFLIQDTKSPEVWRILTVWQSMEALMQMRQSGETPRGILMFRAAHAEPSLSIFKVAHQIIPK